MNDIPIFSDSFFAMDTRCDVILTNLEENSAKQILQTIKDEMDLLENQLSRFNPDSLVSKLNWAKRGEWQAVSNELWDILTICYDFYQMSNGAFDVTITALLNLWKSNESPSDKELEAALEKSGFDKVEFDFENQKIRLLEDGIEFDFEFIQKGIILDTIKPILEEKGVENGIVSFGENTVLALGKHPNGEDWPLGIRNTIHPHKFVHLFSCSNQSVTTLGVLLNVDEGSAQKRNIIVSPATGELVAENKTVSVKTDSATIGEFIALAWLILPENDKLILSEKFKNIEILEVEYLDNDVKTKLTIL